MFLHMVCYHNIFSVVYFSHFSMLKSYLLYTIIFESMSHCIATLACIKFYFSLILNIIYIFVYNIGILYFQYAKALEINNIKQKFNPVIISYINFSITVSYSV